ncbi:MAG: LysR family transcriptional regulator [Pseudobutyrivibrio sp.]|nr:LysR family transcriptional regulator [Pseudobutyrivibrio sp.]
MSILEKKVHYFISVVEEGSFSAAAKKHYVSQANLSKQIVQLEKEIGVALFDRSGYRPVLTDAGKYLYDKLVSISKKENELFDGISRYVEGSVKAGFTGLFENRELIEAIRMYQEKHPGQDIELNRFDFEGCAKALEDEQIDICFGLESIFKRYRNIKYEILHGYDICFVCTKNHPLARLKVVSIDQIKNEGLVVLSKKFSADYYNDFMEACRKDGYEPNINLEVNSFDELILSVCLGSGVALCGESSIREENLVAIPIESTSHAPNYVVAYRDEPHKSNLELFLKFIREYFGTL